MSHSIVDQLRRAIRKSGKTPYAIALATGIDDGILSRFLAEGDQHRDIRLETAARLCSHLKLTLRPKK